MRKLLPFLVVLVALASSPFTALGNSEAASGQSQPGQLAPNRLHSSTFALIPNYEGYLDGADCTSIWGWAWDQSAPNTRIDVDIYDNGSFLARVPANLFRQDLLNAGKGDGYHAFSYTVPASLRNGQLHNMQVKFGGTGFELTWSPRPIICRATMFTTQTPAVVVGGEGSTWENATQFSSNVDGYITHFRFYKASCESGSHTGRLWSDSGTPLVSRTFVIEGPSGWQEVALSSPFPIQKNVKYRVSYNINVCIAKTMGALPITNGPLTAHTSYYSTPAGTFPNTWSGSNSNFFADIRFNSPR